MLNAVAKKIDTRAVYLAKVHRKLELSLIDILQQVRNHNIHRALGYTSLFIYVVERLKMSEAQAYALCAVTRTCEDYPVLRSALHSGQLSIHRASRLVSALDHENAEELVAFATTHSARETEQFIAKHRPRAAKADRIKPLTDELFELRASISHGCLQKLKRAQDLAASRQSDASYAAVLEAALDAYLFKNDPVAKAQRARTKTTRSELAPKPKPKFCARKTRTPLSAAQKHTVSLRDQGQCTYTDELGRRCSERRWLHVHHRQHVCKGGGNEPDNLTTLCAAHHDLVHQLSFDLETGQSLVRH